MGELVHKISLDLLLPESRVEQLIQSAPHRYKVYSIPKRQGRGFRTIAQPAREVKRLQHWVMENLLTQAPVHTAAMAYVTGRSIADNAAIHAGNPYLLKLDFADFFPSITGDGFLEFATAVWPSLDRDDCARLVRLLFWKPRQAEGLQLSIGAPSSPTVSNAVLFPFDRDVAVFCDSRGIAYSRYADDLTFSCRHKDRRTQALKHVNDCVAGTPWPRLKLNESKTFYGSQACRRRVTGLVLSNEGKVSLGRSRKRAIRAAVHRYRHGGMTAAEVRRLRGSIAFARDAEPEFVEHLEHKYGSLFRGKRR